MADGKKICHWYDICPMKRFFEEGRIAKHWLEDYCFNNGKDCQRLRAVEEGRPAPDNMLPNGDIKKDLK